MVGLQKTERLAATTSLEAAIGTHNMKLVIGLGSIGKAAYPTKTLLFNFIVQDAICDCTLLSWIMPNAQSVSTTVKRANIATLTIVHATVDPNSKTTVPAIRRCYQVGQTPCSEITAIVSVVDNATTSLPAFMSLAGSVLTVNPNNNSQSKTYTMLTTMSTPNNGNKTWLTITVVVADCVITDLVAATAPTNKSYTIHALSNLVMDLTTPGFVQNPACGYALAETRSWTIPSGAPLTFDATKYILTASSSRNLDDNIYSVSLSESAVYSGSTFSNSVTFSVTVTDPCLTTVITPFTIADFSLENG